MIFILFIYLFAHAPLNISKIYNILRVILNQYIPVQTTEPTHGKGLLHFCWQYTICCVRHCVIYVWFIKSILNLVEMWPPSKYFAQFQCTVQSRVVLILVNPSSIIVVVPSPSTRWQWENTNGLVLWVKKGCSSFFVSCSFKVNSCKNCTWNMHNDGHMNNVFWQFFSF